MKKVKTTAATEPHNEKLIERLEVPNSPIIVVKMENKFFPTLGAHKLSENSFSSYKSAVEYCDTNNIHFMIQLIAAITHYTYINLNNTSWENK